METLTRLVSESLARHGFDRPVDYRRLQWSRWFRCESHHSLLTVPSKPGVFALAEEIMASTTEYVGTVASTVQGALSEAKASATDADVKELRLSAASDIRHNGSAESRRPEAESRRMLAVSQFFEDDDMAFVLDRMLSHQNPMRARLASGRYFVRYVVIEDATQRRSICNALNQWIVSSAEKATGIGSHFASSLELAHDNVERRRSSDTFAQADTGRPRSSASGGYVEERRFSAPSGRQDNAALAAVPPLPKTSDEISNPQGDNRKVNSAPTLNSAVATNIHCSSSFPSGF